MAEAVVAVVSDLHVNSTVGLCPAKVRRDDGGWYKASRAQRWILECWEDFWTQVDGMGSPVYVVLNGDLPDLNQHTQTQLVEAENASVVLDMVEEVLDLPRCIADAVFVIRGTPAHVGGAGYLEEQLAKRIGAEPSDLGTASWWHLAAEWAGVKFDIGHHPQTVARRPWTRDSAAARQAAITWSEYHEMGEDPPDVVGRGHVHFWAKGYKDDTFCFFSPPWQITTAFGRRLGAGRKVEPIGGVVFECQDGYYTWRDIRYSAERRPIWTAQ